LAFYLLYFRLSFSYQKGEEITKEVVMKFGFGDWGVWAAYVISIASVVICIIYGIIKWNKDDK